MSSDGGRNEVLGYIAVAIIVACFMVLVKSLWDFLVTPVGAW